MSIRRCLCFSPVLFLAAWLGSSGTRAADWPQFRGDAARSGYTADSLSAKPALRWVYRARHAPRPAWVGRDTRMPFDHAPQPVVSGGMLLFGSSADCKVYALETDTGREKWTFFTDAPVRFAPAVWKGRTFVAGDDGFLYCLNTTDGSLRWKHRGGPVTSMVLGNDRMISRWPARGGPVVQNDIVYYAAGIWPSEGIFIHAVDALTGTALWSNDRSGTRYMPQPHGGANAASGVSAQGYLALAGDHILVPTGRAVPAAFRKADGAFAYFHLQQYGQMGGADVVGADTYFLNRGSLFETATGRLLHKSPGTPTPAVTPVVTPAIVGFVTATELLVVERDKLWSTRPTTDRKGQPSTREAFGSPAWRIKHDVKAPSALIVAGSSLVLGGTETVHIMDTETRTTIFQAPVDGVVHGLAASAGNLYVTTTAGSIYCFGEGGNKGPAAIVKPAPPESAAAGNRAAAATAAAIVKRTGIIDGYCLDLGCGDGALALELAQRTNLQIHAIEADAAKVARARKRLEAAGLYGVRVTVHLGDPAATAYPDYVADLVVSARSVDADVPAGLRTEAHRCARPYGGFVCFGKPGALQVTTRGPLAGAGTWTHQYADPANTACSADEAIHGPLGILWFRDTDFMMPSRHGRGPAPLFSNGRLYVEGLNGLRCVNAYNGRTLWEYPLPEVLKAYDQEHLMGTAGTGSNLCVSERAVFVHTPRTCLKLDALSGKRLAAFAPPREPDESPGTWGVIASVGEALFGTLADTDHVVRWRYGRSTMGTQFTESKLLFSMEPDSGAVRWRYFPKHSIRNNTVAFGGGRVFCIDRPQALADRLDQETLKRRGINVAEHEGGTLIALNQTDGSELWRSEQDIFGTMLIVSEQHDVLLMAYQNTRFKLGSEVGGRMAAFRASTGERLWDMKGTYGSRPLLNDRTIYAQPGAWDLLTGARRTDFAFSRSYGCGTLAGSRDLLVYRSATLGYTDLSADHGTESYGGVRPGCWINTLPAGGLVLMPDATSRCVCSYLMATSIALQPYGLRPPAVNPPGGAYRIPIAVTLSATPEGCDIRYTLDGTEPVPDSPRYTQALKIDTTATLKARTFAPRMPPSRVVTEAFTIDPHVVSFDGKAWKAYDSPQGKPPISRWEITGGTATERSNLFVGNAGDADPATERPGSLLIYQPGGAIKSGNAYTDGVLSLELASSDDDVLGVAFRCQGSDRYYLWAMDKQRGFHVLAVKNGTSYRVLTASKKRYEQNRWYRLDIRLAGKTITVSLDGAKDLEATDDTHRSGTFALYAWGCAGAQFRNVRWKER